MPDELKSAPEIVVPAEFVDKGEFRSDLPAGGQRPLHQDLDRASEIGLILGAPAGLLPGAFLFCSLLFQEARHERSRSLLYACDRSAGAVPCAQALAGRADAGGDQARRDGQQEGERFHLHPFRRGAGGRAQGRGQIRQGRRTGRRARRPAGRGQGRKLDQGQADLLRLADLQGFRAGCDLAQQRAHPEGGRHRARAHGDPGILLLLGHAHPALGRHAQPLETSNSPLAARPAARRRAWRRARRRSRPARTSEGRSAFPRPAPASSATSRRTGATPTIRRSTSIPIATPARWRARLPTPSCCRT